MKNILTNYGPCVTYFFRRLLFLEKQNLTEGGPVEKTISRNPEV